jgi:hypothetical protein
MDSYKSDSTDLKLRDELDSQLRLYESAGTDLKARISMLQQIRLSLEGEMHKCAVELAASREELIATDASLLRACRGTARMSDHVKGHAHKPTAPVIIPEPPEEEGVDASRYERELTKRVYQTKKLNLAAESLERKARIRQTEDSVRLRAAVERSGIRLLGIVPEKLTEDELDRIRQCLYLHFFCFPWSCYRVHVDR